MRYLVTGILAILCGSGIIFNLIKLSLSNSKIVAYQEGQPSGIIGMVLIVAGIYEVKKWHKQRTQKAEIESNNDNNF